MSVYLELFHGRRNPHEDLDDWGFEGPVLGPFPFVHITYGSTIKVGINPVISSPYCNSNLHIDEDGFIVFAGSYYGDMSVFDDRSPGLLPKIRGLASQNTIELRIKTNTANIPNRPGTLDRN